MAPKPIPLRLLLEMRPALDGHAGIPQETRLLFLGLSMIDGFSVEGLIQSSTHALGTGLPARSAVSRRSLPSDQQLDRLARVVITLEQRSWFSYWTAVPMVLRHLLGRTEELTRFETHHFRDFIWRRLFARTLSAEDFDRITAANFRIARVPWSVMQRCALVTRRLGYTLYPRLDTSDFDVMIVETPYPATISSRTCLVVRYHDAVPLLMPHTIADRKYHQASHYRALLRNVQSGAWFVCVSNSTRDDLLSIFPQVEKRSLTIHNMLSRDYFDEASSPSRVPSIIRTRLNNRIDPPLEPAIKRRLFDGESSEQAIDYLLIVATIEPRKNHLTVLSAWERLRAEAFPGLKLLLVGTLGWHQKAIVEKFHPSMERGDAFLLTEVPSPELRLLYKHARAVICPSFAEGFDFSGVEAMASGGAVVASDIRTHREIYSDAAEYFDPYSIDDIARVINTIIDPARSFRREELVKKGAVVSRFYSSEAILPKWHSFLTSTLPVST
jgi:glycosyltransferase involved in cell wall biosynthesis